MTKSRLVYSSESGRICTGCGNPISSCSCNKKKPAGSSGKFPHDGVIRVMKESKGHKGKTVTIIGNIPLEDAELKEFAKKLKARCGTGGSVKNNEIIIQGDHRQAAMEEILKQGYKAKFAGG